MRRLARARALSLSRTLSLALALSLAACGASPTRVGMTLSASSGLNPNRDGQPSPTVVRIYELKSVDVFNQLSFFDLYDHDQAKLGADLLNRRELEVQPGKTIELTREADQGARFLGVIAGFRSLNDIPWRGSVPLDPESRNSVEVRLDPTSVTVVKPRRRFLWIF
jgi:type VI secretion system protein VasD